MKARIATFVLACATPVVAQCTITAPGVMDPTPPVDSWSALYTIGFAFPFNGTTYSDIYVSDHGLIAFSNGGTPSAPPPGGQVWDPGTVAGPYGGGGFAGFGADCIFAYWGDHTTGGTAGGGALWVDNGSGSRCTVTWLDNEPYFAFSAGAFTVQLSLYPDGTIVIDQDNRCNNTSSTFGPINTIVGVWQHGSTIPASSDLSSGPSSMGGPTLFEEFVGPGPVFSNTVDPNYDLGNMSITFSPSNPGWSVAVQPLACASTTTIGTGCGGATLTSITAPVLGSTWDLSIGGGGVFNVIGLGFETPPTPGNVLAPGLFGATCNIYTGANLGIIPASTPVMSIVVPLDPSANNLPLVAQLVALLPNVTLNSSNGEKGTFGF